MSLTHPAPQYQNTDDSNKPTLSHEVIGGAAAFEVSPLFFFPFPSPLLSREFMANHHYIIIPLYI